MWSCLALIVLAYFLYTDAQVRETGYHFGKALMNASVRLMTQLLESLRKFRDGKGTGSATAATS
jgi:hypothetical protein